LQSLESGFSDRSDIAADFDNTSTPNESPIPTHLNELPAPFSRLAPVPEDGSTSGSLHTRPLKDQEHPALAASSLSSQLVNTVTLNAHLTNQLQIAEKELVGVLDMQENFAREKAELEREIDRLNEVHTPLLRHASIVSSSFCRDASIWRIK
jgi:hypothetical protein